MKKTNTSNTGDCAGSEPNRNDRAMDGMQSKAKGPRKRPTILDLTVEHEAPFIPPNTVEQGCSKEEYARGRERVVNRQFMRHIARILIKEALSTISKGVANVNT